MIKLRIADVYSGDPRAILPTTVALNSILQQNISGALWAKVRRLLRIIGPEIELAAEGRNRLIEKHAERDDKGERVVVNDSYKMVDQEAFNRDYESLIDTMFEVEPIPFAELERLTLPAVGWQSPIVKYDDEPTPQAKSEAVAEAPPTQEHEAAE